MKKIIFIAALWTGTVSAFAADGFTIKGNIPGLPAGTSIGLFAQEGKNNKIAETTANGNEFILTGSVESPSMCEIRFEVPDSDDLLKAIELMVENVEISVSAPEFNKLAPNFYTGTGGLELEKKVTVKGGKAQEEYSEYKAAMYPYDYAVKDAHYNLYWTEEGKNGGEIADKYAKAYSDAMVAQNNAQMDFFRTHPSYSISGSLLTGMLRTSFAYTNDELDEFANAVSGMWDKARLAKVNKAIEWSRKYPRLAEYTDFVVLNTDGNEEKLSDLIDGSKYTLIDFWASWCGPCRAAIPHVKELHEKYGDKMNVLSVSLDSTEKPWRKAMEKEQMEWKQLWADKERVKGVTEPYQITGIPFLLVLDPQGRIAFAGHGPDELSDFLSKNL